MGEYKKIISLAMVGICWHMVGKNLIRWDHIMEQCNKAIWWNDAIPTALVTEYHIKYHMNSLPKGMREP
jgi:hypothetical protein